MIGDYITCVDNNVYMVTTKHTYAYDKFTDIELLPGTYLVFNNKKDLVAWSNSYEEARRISATYDKLEGACSD